jgi:hypothetical protein
VGAWLDRFIGIVVVCHPLMNKLSGANAGPGSYVDGSCNIL